jgi:hypothetical protein
MFDTDDLVVAVAMVDDYSDESVLVERIAGLEHLKAAAAAGQARATAALDASRRAAEYAAGVPAARRGRGWPVRWRWHGGIRRRAATATSDSPRRW